MIKITIKESKSKDPRGYMVLNDVQGHRYLDYENRARLISGNYLLEERNSPGDSSSPFRQVAIIRGGEDIDMALYTLAKKAEKRTLDALIPKVIDETQIFKRLNEKKDKEIK